MSDEPSAPRLEDTGHKGSARDGDDDGRRGKATDAESVELSFVDLLYAVPVADLAIRVSQTRLQGVTATGWADLSLALWTILLGWIGHHTNRQKLPPEIRQNRLDSRYTFTTLRFPQFLLEVLIVVVYYSIGTQVFLQSGNAGLPAPDISVRSIFLGVMFAMYVCWDILDIAIALRNKTPEGEKVPCRNWAHRAKLGLIVSAIFLLVFGGIWLFWGQNDAHPSQSGALSFDLVAIALLFLYRVAQERLIGCFRPSRPC